MTKLTGYEQHRLDQCEAAIQYGLPSIAKLSAAFSELSDAEFSDFMMEMETDGPLTFGDDWPAVKQVIQFSRGIL